MRSAAVVAGGLVVLAGLGVWMGTRQMQADKTDVRDETAAAVEALDAVRVEKEQLERDAAGERRRAQHAEENSARLQRELETARADLAAATAPPPEPEVPVVPGAARDWREVVGEYPAYCPEGLDEALAEVEWETVAESMSKMPPLIAELAQFIAEGRSLTEMPAETIGSIQRYNGPLVTTAMRLAQHGVAGDDVNGAFSHPGFMSNALAATLLALEMPLSAEQSTALDALTEDYTIREQRRLAGYGDDAYVLEQLVDASRLKHEYFTKVYALLEDEQHATLRPEAVRGRTQLDIFCESLVWAGRVGPLVFTDRADLAGKAGGWVISRGQVPQENHARTMELVAGWVEDLPEEFLDWEPDGLVKAGMLQVAHADDSAGRVLDLLRLLHADLDLDDAGRAKLRAVPGSIVPYRQAAADGE